MFWKICFRLLFFAAVVHSDFNHLKNELNLMAEKGIPIVESFVPSKNGFRDSGRGFVFKGTRVAGGERVILKFETLENRKELEREFNIYEKLKPNATQYGIPTVYYYGELLPLKEYMLMVLPDFEGEDLSSSKINFDRRNVSSAINILILFRDFVDQSEYMHTCGIRHDNIKPSNIAIRGGRMWLINFNLSSEIGEDNRVEMDDKTFLPRKYFKKEPRTRKSDWESFLYTMAYISGIQLGWFEYLQSTERGYVGSRDEIMENEKPDCDLELIWSRLIFTGYGSKASSEVFTGFAAEALNNQEIHPTYRETAEFIREEMGKRCGESLMMINQRALQAIEPGTSSLRITEAEEE